MGQPTCSGHGPAYMQRTWDSLHAADMGQPTCSGHGTAYMQRTWDSLHAVVYTSVLQGDALKSRNDGLVMYGSHR